MLKKKMGKIFKLNEKGMSFIEVCLVVAIIIAIFGLMHGGLESAFEGLGDRTETTIGTVG